MFKQLVLISALMVLGCQAGYGYGNNGGSSRSSSGGYGSSSNYGGGNSYQPVSVSVQSKHNVRYYDVPSTPSYNKMAPIEVNANPLPLSIIFRSASSYLNLQQEHQGAPGSQQETESEDEPHILKHYVKKPVLQEVREVVTPQRKIVQEILPVDEQVETLIARSTPAKNYDSGYGNGPSSSSPKSYGSGSGRSKSY